MQPSIVAPPDAAASDPMDVTDASGQCTAPPSNENSSPDTEQGQGTVNGNMDSHVGIPAAAGAAAMANAQPPKVVQTAFIHKLYNMLEDRSIEHLISWSNTNESFVMSPSPEFSKVLAQYFKHTNVSSFVRQLNMYGFHKVSDVFHGGSPDSTLWEFRHGNGSFKKGDLVGLRDIKRRASKHALIHRESFSGHKVMPPAQPGTPAEPILDPLEQRLVHLEHTLYRMGHHISRTEDGLSGLGVKLNAVMDGLLRCHEWNHTISSQVQSLAPADSALQAGVSNMQKEISRQIDALRAMSQPHDSLLNGRQPYFGNMSLDSHAPNSPRHNLFDESRRSSAQTLEPPSATFSQGYVGRAAHHRPTSPRPYGLGPMSHQHAATYDTCHRPPPPLHRPSVTSTATADDSPNLVRRHTSADIRQHGWPPNLPPMPPAPPNLGVPPHPAPHSAVNPPPSSAWPSSPSRPSKGNSNPNSHLHHHHNNGSHQEHQHLRDHLAAYELNPSVSRRHALHPHHNRPATPPPLTLNDNGPLQERGNWPSSAAAAPAGTSSWTGGLANGPSSDHKVRAWASDLHSAPNTRRGSTASNVHSLLNPTDRVEKEHEDDDRKRKRV